GVPMLSEVVKRLVNGSFSIGKMNCDEQENERRVIVRREIRVAKEAIVTCELNG
ncbi:hypothetical protein L195_g047544, partial [Trifolium pratense]